MDWVYKQIIGFLANFFAEMGNMGAEMFEMSWVQMCIRDRVQAAAEFSKLKIGFRGDLPFRNAEAIDVAEFLHGSCLLYTSRCV